MKNFFRNFTIKQIIIAVVVVICLFIWGGFTVFATVKKQELLDQNAADRWSAENDTAQISCFFTEGTKVDKNSIMTFEHQLDAVLRESSITSTNENARLWADAYSAQGKVTIKSGKSSLELNAVGIGGDFFMFHPVQLINGTYFSGNDLMHDRIIIDEDAAWQLFGSNDVTGMEVYIGGVPHYICGVIRRADGRMHEAAGLDKTCAYISYETLEEQGNIEGINTYEIVMPNPVSGFAYAKVKEKFGIDELGMQVVENSARYGFKSLFTVISEFGTRSMNSYAIGYPYWENVARGWEDIFAIILILQILFLFIPACIIIITLIILWKRKEWTWRDVWRALQTWKDNVANRFHKEKNKWKYF
ncbi:MAG: ABC transporter permease [Clostridiales bacterium]|nr:ABC transporter permease [Clostridiales bacterium]